MKGDPRDRFVEEFAGMVRPGGRVLDLGCGAGVPSTRRLAESFSAVGVDISAEQIARARQNIPGAELIRADVRDVDFPARSFDGVCALYSISHVPREDHARLFASVRRWLRPGGVFLASLGSGDLAGSTGEWLGVPMFFSSHSAPENRRLLDEAGLEAVRDEIVTMHEPEGDVTFHWVIRRAVRSPLGR
ncbi:MAG TPA: class I SAM-dependent methyltransferase [Gaiellales bacterium]